MVLLNEIRGDSVFAQHRFTKDFGKETTLVVVANRPYFLHVGDFGRNDLHWESPIDRMVEHRIDHKSNATVAEPVIRRYRRSVAASSVGGTAEPILNQSPGDRIAARQPEIVVVGMRQHPVTLEPARVLELAVIDRNRCGRGLGIETEHDIGGERPRLRGMVMHRRHLDRGFLAHLACDGVLRLSPGSTKPASVEYMPGRKFLLRPSRARSPSVTSMITAGSVRGKCIVAQPVAVQRRT